MASLQHAMRGRGVTEPCTWSYDTTLILDQANTPENRGLCAHSHPHTGQTIKKSTCNNTHAETNKTEAHLLTCEL